MIRKKSRKCEKCGKILASPQSLWEHKEINLSEKSKKKDATYNSPYTSEMEWQMLGNH